MEKLLPDVHFGHLATGTQVGVIYAMVCALLCVVSSGTPGTEHILYLKKGRIVLNSVKLFLAPCWLTHTLHRKKPENSLLFCWEVYFSSCSLMLYASIYVCMFAANHYLPLTRDWFGTARGIRLRRLRRITPDLSLYCDTHAAPPEGPQKCSQAEWDLKTPPVNSVSTRVFLPVGHALKAPSSSRWRQKPSSSSTLRQ